MSGIILLTGANGKTGRAVLTALVGLRADVRVFIRDESQWPALEALGAKSYALGDMLDPETIALGVAGCNKVIHIGPPMHPEEKIITSHFIEAARQQGVEHFIYYSVMHPLRREVRHHRLKLDTEELLIESGLPYTIAQPIRYMQHLLPIWTRVLEEGVHAMPFNTEVQFNVVDLKDLAEAVAIIAIEQGHQYATYELAGPESLSQQQMADIITDVIGKPVSAEAILPEQIRASALAKGFSSDRAEQMVIMNQHYDDYGFLGSPNILSWILGRPPGTYREFVESIFES
jgi:uncharacterized protein YbjT (DUF2867 family)